MFLLTDLDKNSDEFQDERKLALEYLADAWSEAEEEGLNNEAIAHAALFAAIATLVRDFGEESTAQLMEKLPRRIRHGEYTLDRSIQ